MSRSRVYINESPQRFESEIDRRNYERYERLAGVRPLDGTNLAWVYDRCPQCGSEMKQGQLGRECGSCGLRANASR